MNAVDAKAIPLADGSFHAAYRKVHKAGYEIVRVKGRPVIFDNAHAAECVGWRALKEHLCRDILGGNADRAKRNAAEVNRVFKNKNRRAVTVQSR